MAINREEMDEISEYLQEQLRDAGLPHLADPSRYAIEEAGQRFEPEPIDYIGKVIKALSAELKLQSRDIVLKSIERINRSLPDGNKVKDVFLELDPRLDKIGEVGHVDLLDAAPDYRELLEELDTFYQTLHESFSPEIDPDPSTGFSP